MSKKDIGVEDANPILKKGGINLNQSFKNAESQTFSLPISNIPLPQTLTESHVNLVKIFLKHVASVNLRKIPENISQIKQTSSGSNLTKNFFCEKCSFINLKVRLKCGHSKCFNCLKLSVLKLNECTTDKNLKSIICKKCFSLPSPEEIIELIGNNASISQIFPILTKKCGYCRRESNIYTEFFFELKCLHLCKNCYVDQIYIGANKCLVCQKKFKNSAITKSRLDICSDCRNQTSYFNEALKSYAQDNLLCYSCQNIAYRNRRMNALTIQINGKDSLAPFKTFINKLCSICNESSSLDNIRRCESCENLICETCINDNPQCRLCLGYFQDS